MENVDDCIAQNGSLSYEAGWLVIYLFLYYFLASVSTENLLYDYFGFYYSSFLAFMELSGILDRSSSHREAIRHLINRSHT